MNNKQTIRYTSFIDILGFKSSVLNIENEPESYEKISTILTSISAIDELRKIVRAKESDHAAIQHFEKTQDLRIQAFSDCILISANSNDLGLVAVTAMSALAYRILFTHGFYARGAITKDLLTHNENIVFGKALVRAYSLEQKVAIYPRVVLSQELYDDLSNRRPAIPKKIDFDGQPFLDIFDASLLKFIKTWNERQPNLHCHINLEKGREELIRNIQISKDPAIQQKLTWLKNYLNSNAINLGINHIVT